MPPPPPLFLLILTLTTISFPRAAATATTSTTPTCPSLSTTHTNSPCPPFATALLPYPFSTTPGRGHPSFHINCTTPHSTLSINNLPFSLLHFDPNTSSLLLSPRSHSPPPHYNHSLSLSSPTFHVSDAFCSRLSALHQCPQYPPPNCSASYHHPTWECELIKKPTRLLRECASTPRPATDQGCTQNVLVNLHVLLQCGIQVEYDSTHDPYFTNCTSCRAKKGVCGYNALDPGKPFICFRSESRLSPLWFGKNHPTRIAIMGFALSLASVLVIVSFCVAVFRSRWRVNWLSPASIEEDPAAIFLNHHRGGTLLPPVFTYDELEQSTNRFDAKRKIGDGGFGSVYLGHLADGRNVAVKYLHKSHAATRAIFTKSFCNEILILSSLQHPNLVKLHGYCSDPRGLILVYDYVPNGTLADHLHGPKRKYVKGSFLTWQVRLEIALQVALAMEYLHFSVTPPIVHRDITSSNIFVEKDMKIKVGDFGLSRILNFADKSSFDSESGCVWTGPQGTPGYLDPDYHRSFRLTEKSDVYSFGVVLLELVTGLKPVDQKREKREMALVDLVVGRIQTGLLHQVVDPTLDKEAMDGVEAVAELAFRCVAADKDDRPDSREVVDELDRIRGCTRVLAE